MSTGKRRANWETVLEERMAAERSDTERQTLQVVELATRLNADRIDQCHALEYKVDQLKKEVRQSRKWLVAACASAWIAFALAVLK